MQAASAHALALVFAVVIARLGWYMAHNSRANLTWVLVEDS
jgi:hypothetical protein